MNLERLHIKQVILVLGPGGCGKSCLIHHINKVMREHNLGHLLTTAYTGVAAAPFAGPTLMKLMGLFVLGLTKLNSKPMTAARLANALEKFQKLVGYHVGELGGLVIDEVSFVTCRLLGMISKFFFSQLLNCDLPFGGIPVMLAGDNFQKEPPSDTPFYQTMAYSCCGEQAIE